MTAGRIVRPHGVRGEVVVEVLTDFPERLVPRKEVVLRGAEGRERPGRIASARPHAGRLLVRFDGVTTPEAAGELRQAEICVPPLPLKERPEGFFFHWEIEGCEAVSESGRRLGIARELLQIAGRAVLVLETGRGPRDVPFVAPIVVSVDVAGRRIVLAPPEGLLD